MTLVTSSSTSSPVLGLVVLSVDLVVGADTLKELA